MTTNLKSDVLHKHGICNINIIESQNENGYDFGKFYRILTSINLRKYSQIAFVNDSCILFGDLKKLIERVNLKGIDVWALTDSYAGFKGYSKNDVYHLQSYFLVFKGIAIEYMYKYLANQDFDKNYNFKNSNRKELRIKVIVNCEIGLSEYLAKHGLTLCALFPVRKYVEVNNYTLNKLNPTVHLWRNLISDGFPMIKKKIVNGCLRNDIVQDIQIETFSWYETIKENNKSINRLNDIFKEFL